MIHYILIDASGNVCQRGSCSLESEIPTSLGLRHEIIEPSDPRRPQVIPAQSLSDLRRNAYPPIGDQLDTLWHAMDDGLLPKIPGFYDRIKSVKDAYPKTQS